MHGRIHPGERGGVGMVGAVGQHAQADVAAAAPRVRAGYEQREARGEEGDPAGGERRDQAAGDRQVEAGHGDVVRRRAATMRDRPAAGARRRAWPAKRPPERAVEQVESQADGGERRERRQHRPQDRAQHAFRLRRAPEDRDGS